MSSKEFFNPDPQEITSSYENKNAAAGWPVTLAVEEVPLPGVSYTPRITKPEYEKLNADTGEKYPDIEQLQQVYDAATDVFIAIWKAIQNGSLSERGPISDSALVLRDTLNPEWPNNPNWLPDELK